MKKVPKKY